MSAPSAAFVAVSLLLALLPSVFWLALYLWEDRRDPEPRQLLARLFAAGIICALAAVILQEPVRRAAGGSPVGLDAWAVLLIALIEKGLMLVAAFAVAWRHPAFDQLLDGVVYLVAVALGFAFVENFLFFAYWVPANAPAVHALGETLARVSLLRFLLTTFVHASTAGVAGLALGAARFSRLGAWLILPAGFAVSVLLHAAFDAAVLAGYLAEAAVAVSVFGLAFLALLQFRGVTRLRVRAMPE